MASPAMATANFSHDQFWVRRKIFTLFGQQFHFYDNNDQLIAYSKQKAFKLKEDIRIYADESMSRELITIKARNIIDISATYDVFDGPTQQRIGSLKRAGLKSAFVRDEWSIRGTGDENLGTIAEDNWILGLIRRNLINLIPQNYNIDFRGSDIGSAKQNWNFLVPKLRVDLSGDPMKQLDRRLAAAAIVLIMAIEGRQN